MFGMRDGAFRCFVTTRERQSVKTLSIDAIDQLSIDAIGHFDIRQ